MALLGRIYFNAVFGALGGLLGWMLFGAFGDKVDARWALQAILSGLLIGGSIGYFVVSVEAIRDLSLVRFCRLASYGVLISAVGGAVGSLLGEVIHHSLIETVGPGAGFGKIFLFALARGIGWTFLGVAIGLSEGVAARSLGKLSYGTIGGAMGGFLGGTLYGFFLVANFRHEAAQTGDATSLSTYVFGAIGLVFLGACIGSLSAFVQGVMQPASVKVLRGWQEGREYPLDKAASLLGRDEHADIALFRDMRVEKRHAFVRREGNDFVLVNHGAPPEHTRVNDQPVASSCELRDGDRIQLGNVLLRFQLRAAQALARPPRAAAPVIGRA